MVVLVVGVLSCRPASSLWTKYALTDLSDELAVKKTAICEARSSTKPTIPAEQAGSILKANLAL